MRNCSRWYFMITWSLWCLLFDVDMMWQARLQWRSSGHSRRTRSQPAMKLRSCVMMSLGSTRLMWRTLAVAVLNSVNSVHRAPVKMGMIHTYQSTPLPIMDFTSGTFLHKDKKTGWVPSPYLSLFFTPLSSPIPLPFILLLYCFSHSPVRRIA